MEPTREEPPGTRYQTYFSKSIGGEASYLLYLPPDYEKDSSKHYPVLYFLPGGQLDQRSGGGIVRVVDGAIRDGKLPPIIVLVPQGVAGTMWTDSFDGKQPAESLIVRDLVPYIDRTYRTIPRREARWIEGFSIGGRGAAHIGLEYTSVFGAVSILSGALMDVGFFARFNGGLMFRQVCGSDNGYFDKHDPWRLAEQNSQALRGNTVVRIMVGDQDTMGSQVPGYEVRRSVRAFHEHLDGLRIPHQYIEVPGVGHAYAALFLRTGDPALEFYRRAFERVPQAR